MNPLDRLPRTVSTIIIRGLHAVGLVLWLVGFSACDGAVDPAIRAADHSPGLAQHAAAKPAPPREPTLRNDGPVYPAAVLYILYREYVHKNPGITSLSPEDPQYQNYIERRLRQLYPARGHSGMMREAAERHRQNLAAWRDYERAMRDYEQQYGSAQSCEEEAVVVMSLPPACGGTSDPYLDPSWDGQEEFAVPDDSAIPTIQMEIDSLQLDAAEVQEIYYYESLATGTYRGEPTWGGGGGGGGGEQILAAGEAQLSGGDELSPQVVPEVMLAGLMGLGLAGWKYYRAKQAIRRALDQSAELFPGFAGNDDQRDAFRHIYLSMMFRRYLGKTITKWATDRHESNSTGPTHVMDLHNNDIGRTHRYERFRNHWFWDRWDWREWARRVRDYINNTVENAAFLLEWRTSPPTTEQAWQREASVPDARYIYFRQPGD
jgi:hypothetical protein